MPEDGRKHGISEEAFYKYKAKFGGMEISDARKLKALEDETAKLKKLLVRRRPWRGAELTGNILARGEFHRQPRLYPMPARLPSLQFTPPRAGFLFSRRA